MSYPIINDANRVILNGDWAEEIIYDVAWSETEHINEFRRFFDIDGGDYLRDTDFYQGNNFMRVIRRKDDGKLFGYPYESASGIDGFECELYANGEDHGFEQTFNDDYTETLDGPYWVFLPVKEISIRGYTTEEPNGAA